ncbi:hypothetical protein K9L16_00065 [Candidatus Pacearchaeota archaeon]|nr:hypothetical protein [Candidatus Pacearchaeota archaeon]
MKYQTKRKLITGLVVFLLLVFYLLKNFSWSVRISGTIFGLFLFYLIDYLFKLNFELRHYIYVIIILFFGILLSPFYFMSEHYDKILHFILPIFGSCLIYYIADKQRVSFKWKLLITFMFIISFLTIHEIGEYLLDLLWDLKLQGVYVRDISGIEKLNLVMQKHDDTMIDLILGIFGGLVFVIGKTSVYLFKKLKKK